MPRIRIANGPKQNEIYEIGDTPLEVGRDATCSIQLSDKGVSRQHCEFFRIGEMCFVRDKESRNGTFVNDIKITEELLREGDRIQVGSTVFIFESMEKKAPDFEYDESEETFGSTLELRLEDLSTIGTTQGDGTEAQRLRALYQLGRLLAQCDQEVTLVAQVLPFVAEQIHADFASLFTYDAKKGAIVPIGTHHRSGKKGSKVSRSIIRRTLQEKRGLLTSDAMRDMRFSSQDSIVLKEIHSVICVPLSASGDVAGVLYLASDNPTHTFLDEDLELAAAMADSIGLAISNLQIRAAQREHMMSTIRALVNAFERRTPHLKGYAERIARYAVIVGRQLGMSPPDLENLRLAALLHRVGAWTCNGLTSSSEKREEDERKIIQATLEIVRPMACFPQIEDTIRYQLERYDGSGPEGLKGDAIPLSSSILAVVKEFDRLAHPSHSEKSPEARFRDAVIHLGRQAGRTFPDAVVKALLVTHRNGTLHEEPEEET